MADNRLYLEQVASLPSLGGKCVAITGCTSGTGFWLAAAAVTKGASCVLLLNRPSERALAAEKQLREYVTGSTEIKTIVCDLTSFRSVRSAAVSTEKNAAKFGGLSVLCCNAGVMGFPDTRTEDRLDVQMQTNHTSHFLLTKLLLPALEAAADAHGDARVVQHSSGARYLAPFRLQREYFLPCEPGSLGGDSITWLLLRGNLFRYHMTKLANSTFAQALHFRLRARGSRVKSLCAEPGLANTTLTPTLLAANGMDRGFSAALAALLGRFVMQSAADGACPLIACCFGAHMQSGDFLMPRRSFWGPPTLTICGGAPRFGLLTQSERLSCSEANQRVLWEASEAAIGETFDI